MIRRALSILGILTLCMSAFLVPSQGAEAAQSGTYDINIWTTTSSGQSVYDVCYTLVDYSNVGCDVNRDGAIYFEAIPAGSYYVQPSYPNGGNYSVAGFTINVNAYNTNFYATASSGGGSSTSSGTQGEVKIWTINSQTGAPVYDVCYQLHTTSPWSNIGCDENGDGAVTFADVPYGEYRVHASYPAGNRHTVEPILIYVNPHNSDFTIQAIERAAANPETTDVLLLTRDPETGDSLTDVCFELVGFSNIGCDENNDGRVSFEAIPYGTYTIRQTTTPAGYTKMNDYQVKIGKPVADGPLTILLAQSAMQAQNGHTNYSVVFFESGTNKIVPNPQNCAQFFVRGHGPISNLGCDEDIEDGQVDFMGVEVTPQGFSSHHRIDFFAACEYSVIGYAGSMIVGDSTAIIYAEVKQSGASCR